MRSLFFSGVDWLWPTLLCAGLLAALVIWSYRRSSASPGVRAACLFLKLLGIAALAFCLLEPLWNRQRPRPGGNFFVVLADNSQGMQIKDRDAARSRGEVMKESLIGDKASWQETIGETFALRRYFFDSRLQAAESFDELSLDGRASAINSALRKIAQRYEGQPLAGVLLFTDGNATDISGTPDVAGLPPVYPVVIGHDDVLKDVSVQKIAVSEAPFEDAPVTIQADISAAGYSGEEIVAQLLDGDGKKVEEQKQRANGNEQMLAFRFRLKPDKRGLCFYQVRAAAKSELEQFTNPQSSREATLANNSRIAVVDRGKGPYRILYVAGRPNWEFKFLNRALADDDQLELVALIRVAKREPKFQFLGRRGESSNPLFRGFDKKDEETERYDQPVLVRLNTKDEFELKGGFPKTAEDLYAYHAIILDDLESEFFTRDQMMLLQKFVSERGGGFLMLGGAESFREGKYARTPIGDMLPVYLDRANEAKMPTQLKLTLTREGWLQPWVRLRSTESDERVRLAGMVPFEVLNEAHDVKPGASVLATVSDAQSRTYPALVVQRFGNGRTGGLLVGDLWRWGMRDEAMHRDMDKAWRQMMRWLVTDVPQRIEVTTHPSSSGEAITLQVKVRDKEFQPMDNASVRFSVEPLASDKPGTNAVNLTADAAAKELGVFESTYVPRQTGGYRVQAMVSEPNGAELGRAQSGWTSDPAAEEFRSLKPNRALLETIAKQTGGEMVALNALEAFAKGLPNRKAPVTENFALPLWHTPAIFLFALGCFVAEWGVRRWKGLP